MRACSMRMGGLCICNALLASGAPLWRGTEGAELRTQNRFDTGV